MSRPQKDKPDPVFSPMDYDGIYGFDRDSAIFDSRIAVRDVECLQRELDYTRGRFLSADYPLVSSAAAFVDSLRDLGCKQRSDLLLIELEDIERNSLAIKDSLESTEEKSIKINLDAERCFNSLLVSLQDEIGEFIVAIDGDETWEALLKKVIVAQYTDEGKLDYRALNEFVMVLFGATYHGARNSNGELKDRVQREEVFQKIKSAADLQNCVGGASGAIFSLYQNFSTELSFWTAGIKQSLILQLSGVCSDGNITHLDAWLEHLLTGVPGPDKTDYFASMDMPTYISVGD